MPHDTRINRMGFSLSEEQVMIGAAARDFAQRRLAPRAAERDRSSVFPAEEVQEAANLGLLAMKVPAEVGGAGHGQRGLRTGHGSYRRELCFDGNHRRLEQPHGEDSVRPRE